MHMCHIKKVPKVNTDCSQYVPYMSWWRGKLGVGRVAICMPRLKHSGSEEEVLPQPMVEPHIGSSVHCHIFSRCLCVYSVYKDIFYVVFPVLISQGMESLLICSDR